LIEVASAHSETRAIEESRFRNDYFALNEIARLQGARLALIDEGDKVRPINSDLVKKLTGGTVLNGKKMGKDTFQFRPTHKLILLGNHKPRIDVDTAMRRRLHLIPLLQSWSVNPTEGQRKADDSLKARLLLERPGILARMVKGFVKWKNGGLRPPKVVMDFTAEFFEEADHIENWLEAEGLVRDPNGFLPTAVIWASWCRYADAVSIPRGYDKSLSGDLEKRGFSRTRKRQAGLNLRGFAGLRSTKEVF